MNIHRFAALSALTSIAVVALAQDEPPARPEPDTSAQATSTARVDLEGLVREVAASSGREFLLDPRARQVFVAGTPVENMTYPVLLSILRLNGYAAVEVEGRVNIVPDAIVRQLAPPLLQADDPNVADDEWVMRIIDVPDDGIENRAAMLVPILRPMMPQTAHFAAFPQAGKLIIVDRYANVRRITAIVGALTD